MVNMHFVLTVDTYYNIYSYLKIQQPITHGLLGCFRGLSMRGTLWLAWNNEYSLTIQESRIKPCELIVGINECTVHIGLNQHTQTKHCWLVQTLKDAGLKQLRQPQGVLTKCHYSLFCLFIKNALHRLKAETIFSRGRQKDRSVSATVCLSQVNVQTSLRVQIIR